MRHVIMFFVVGGLFSCFLLNAQTLNVSISNIRNSLGNIILSFYSNPESFPYKPDFTKKFPKQNLNSGTIYLSFEGIQPGKYAITLLDDEDSDNKMKYRFGLPLEGFGFSNCESFKFSAPKFEDCSFIHGSETTEIKIKIRYLYK